MATQDTNATPQPSAAQVSRPVQVEESDSISDTDNLTVTASGCRFNIFPLLPEELRVKIWKEALASSKQPRIIQLAYDEQICDYRVLNQLELKRTGFHQVVRDIAQACLEGRRVVDMYMTDDERAYHNVNLPFLEDTVNTDRDIFFFKQVDYWPFDGHGPKSPVFLPLADEAGKWGRFDLMPRYNNNALPKAWITLSELRNCNRRHPGLNMDLTWLNMGFIFQVFTTHLFRRSITILLDDPDEGYIDPDDWNIVPFGPDVRLDNYEKDLRDDLREIEREVQARITAYQENAYWDLYDVFLARIKTKAKGHETVEVSGS